MKNIIQLLFFSFIIIYSCSFVYAQDITINTNIPKAVMEFAEQRKDCYGNNYSINYIMKWHGYKVYSIRKKTYGIVYNSPLYIIYDGKKIVKPRIEEYNQLIWDVQIYTNNEFNKNNKILTKKLLRNAEKVMDIENSTKPPEIPPALYKYANKYMMRGYNVEFLYIMDWNGYHVYRTYWKRYGFIFNPLTVILYDGHTIRRPTNEEFDIIKDPIRHAYEQYLNEQARLYNKD